MTGQVQPPRWTDDEFRADVNVAITLFREQRVQEPLGQYLEAFAVYRKAVEHLIDVTAGLNRLRDHPAEYLADPDLLVVVRYLASPAISEDDLKVLADAVLSPSRLVADEQMARRVVDVVLLGLDRHRFPWVEAGREPGPAEREAAVTATAALIATQKVQTLRRNTAKSAQEQAVARRLVAQGYTEVPTRVVRNLTQAPGSGQFCGESLFGSRKADLVIGLWDGRTMPLECKVSNSSVNSVKRLNNDAAVKAKTWIQEFGTQGVVPAAVLSGVFNLRNLRSAQSDGLTIFWAHRLDALAEFTEATRQPLHPGGGRTIG